MANETNFSTELISLLAASKLSWSLVSSITTKLLSLLGGRLSSVSQVQDFYPTHSLKSTFLNHRRFWPFLQIREHLFASPAFLGLPGRTLLCFGYPQIGKPLKLQEKC